MKVKILLRLIFLQLFLVTNLIQPQSYVTYEIPGGRLGDKLIAYIHAKWLSYKYGLRLLYKPFEYSDKFMFSQLEDTFDKCGPINQVIRPRHGDNPDFTNQNNVLFEIAYFPQCKTEILLERDLYYHFDIDLNDPIFRAELRKALSCVVDLETIKPPKDCASLAVQVRRNSGGFDAPLSFEVIKKLGYLPENQFYADYYLPLKHPSDEYYIEQIKKTLKFFGDQKVYIFIFTDDPEPAGIVETYSQLLKDYKNITFDYRKTINRHNLNVLEDLFSMANFDALIRGSSNLGYVASLIGNFKLAISPRGFRTQGHKIIIDQVDILKNNANSAKQAQ